MSVATPTVIPQPPIFPRLLPKPPQPHPTPLPKPDRVYGRLNVRRDLVKEMEDLSEEENELEELNMFIHNRGYSTLIPMGRNLTQQEEKNDADDEDDDDDSQSGPTGAPASPLDDVGENDSTRDDIDLDADMEDADGDGDISNEAERADDAMGDDTEALREDSTG